MIFANVWYIADWSESVTDRPVKVKMLGREFVLFRDQQGKAICLRNIYQDKAVAEGRLPKRAPDVAAFPPIAMDREDRLLQAYWQLMRELRGMGWQIDRLKLDEAERNGEVRVIRSPGRRANPADWVYQAVPFVPATAPKAATARGPA